MENERDEVAKRVLYAHRAYFDVFEDYRFAGRTFFGYAEFHSYDEQYVLVKRAALWEAHSHEYLFIDTVAHLDAAYVLDAVEFLKTKAISKVNPTPDHMSSNLTMVIVADSCDEDALLELRRTRFRKNYKFGLRGWSDIRIAAIDLEGHRVVTNAAAKDMFPTLLGNAGFADDLDAPRPRRIAKGPKGMKGGKSPRNRAMTAAPARAR